MWWCGPKKMPNSRRAAHRVLSTRAAAVAEKAVAVTATAFSGHFTDFSAAEYLPGPNERGVDDVLRYEPYLQLIGAHEVAHDEVVGAVIAGFVGPLGVVVAVFENGLVGAQQA